MNIFLDGGGECATDGDCNYNGVCENDPTNKKVCMCAKEFGGSYCDGKLFHLHSIVA